MNTGVIIAVIIAVVVLAAAAAAYFILAPGRRSKRLKERFGPEYQRAVDRHGDDRAAEHDLEQREKRRSRLEIRDLSESSRRSYADGWAAIQRDFVDAPSPAVRDAQDLVTRLMSERGYPTEGFEQQADDLSVDHARTIEDYRRAHATARKDREGRAETEELRDAMVRYRALFADLLNGGGRGASSAEPNAPADSPPAHGARTADAGPAGERRRGHDGGGPVDDGHGGPR